VDAGRGNALTFTFFCRRFPDQYGENVMLKVTCGGLLVAISLCAAAYAQGPAKPPAKRTVLQQTDVSTAAPQETIFGTVEIVPGSGNGFHTHNGTEIGYVLEGHIRLEKKGETPMELGPGQSFLVPRGVVHRSVLVGNEPVKLVNSWVVDKGKPLLIPAPNQ
jgi:quercetin dioxygenase-like cupin family protein